MSVESPNLTVLRLGDENYFTDIVADVKSMYSKLANGWKKNSIQVNLKFVLCWYCSLPAQGQQTDGLMF